MDTKFCPTCGAVVAGGQDEAPSALLHATWHALLERKFRALAEEASRYKPPPTYG